MDVKGRGGTKTSEVQADRDNDGENEAAEEEEEDLRRGPWMVEEDFALMDYISRHGEGRWNSLARCAGLKRTGKSCRLRWLNYLRPDVRRGNITLEEQLLILELHSRWGNRWSKIAQYLPGRTDNEIKNYWRTRVQKHAKQLNCDVNSKQFKDAMRYLWMPRLVERIQASAAAAASQPSSFPSTSSAGTFSRCMTATEPTPNFTFTPKFPRGNATPENSSTGASSESFGTQFSSGSNSLDHFQGPAAVMDCYQATAKGSYPEQSLMSSPSDNLQSYGADFQDNQFWLDEFSDNLWNSDNVWFPQQQP
ncbi:hypothetical protein MLD38_035997 [Melastoma candidum]|uniref:Uncharacterized protein n=1 Tax=Melastoma candidum TaxID=119954 RepID=A0ACB9LII6_9MYRT|nr:hypothetical protein MLD38_035997 [Melastoma candidum]